MTKKEELMRKVQSQRRFYDDLILEIAALPEQEEKNLIVLNDEFTEERLMNARQVQAFYGIKAATFYNWRKKGIISPGENFGGSVKSKRWRYSEINAALKGENNENVDKHSDKPRY